MSALWFDMIKNRDVSIHHMYIYISISHKTYRSIRKNAGEVQWYWVGKDQTSRNGEVHNKQGMFEFMSWLSHTGPLDHWTCNRAKIGAAMRPPVQLYTWEKAPASECHGRILFFAKRGVRTSSHQFALQRHQENWWTICDVVSIWLNLYIFVSHQ